MAKKPRSTLVKMVLHPMSRRQPLTVDPLAKARGAEPNNFSTVVLGIPGPGTEHLESHFSEKSGGTLRKGTISICCDGNFALRAVEIFLGTPNVAGS